MIDILITIYLLLSATAIFVIDSSRVRYKRELEELEQDHDKLFEENEELEDINEELRERNDLYRDQLTEEFEDNQNYRQLIQDIHNLLKENR